MRLRPGASIESEKEPDTQADETHRECDESSTPDSAPMLEPPLEPDVLGQH